ncbi:MAG: iron-containing alcohol dehydrogenase [Marivibrio sp.]|uniref:iron-containing alcohol dehydrogenase n=1 Tax=Marivibrio sp. TaxID=2039719 RepID=UPI0032EEDB6D
MKTISGNWGFPTKVWAGPGRIEELPAACREAGIARPLFVTDEGLRDLPIVRDALARLEAAGLPATLYADVRGNPVEPNVAGGVAAYRGSAADGVVAFGGGSALDVGKAVALMVGQTRPIWDFEDVGDWWTRANAEAIAPIVAAPTTAGTGSEVGRASVVTHPETQEKKIIFHPKMLPAVVISDPELTVGLPPHVTAATGLDAFIHCFEAYCAPGFHPMADGIALEGMRLIKDALPRAYADGGDIEARADMLAAASMGATAFQKGLGGVHAISHAVGATYDTHHGLTNAVVWPYVMRRNEAAIAERMDLLARVLDLPGRDFAAALDWALDFRAALGVPNALSALDVPVDRSAHIGDLAARDPSAGGNPIPLDAAAYAELFVQASEG